MAKKTYVEKYIRFDNAGLSATGKTRVWDVIEIKKGESIGKIKWYGGFRKYVFFPLVKDYDWLLFDSACLHLISDFLDDQNRVHLESKGKMYHHKAPEYAVRKGRVERV